MTDKQKLAKAVEATAAPTSTGYTAKVVQSGHLGLFALQFHGENVQFTLFDTLTNLAQLANQIQVDIARQGDLAHLWWTPEVDA